MIQLLKKLFIKNSENTKDPTVRRAYGTMASVLGILVNILLCGIKLLAGLLTGSISICADAVNNLSDAGSSVIALVSFKISTKPADREHPFGHARIEYVASMIVAFLILFIGAELVRGSVQKLTAPVAPTFSVLSIIILSVSVAVKLWMGLFNRRLGKQIGSEVIAATAVDCLSDASATAAVLIATIVAPLVPAPYNAYIDPVMGLLVAALILWAGLRVLNDAKNSILGDAPDPETVEQIRRLVAEYPEALAIHDLWVHKYGPGHTLASLHVEVDGKKDVFTTHDTIDLIERRLQSELGILCTIHLDPIVTDDETVSQWRERIMQIAQKLHNGIKIHDFRMVPGTTHTNLIFDMEVPFDHKKTDEEIKAEMAALIAAEDDRYFAVITVDRF
ncbi:MAG: cation transporter [Ruminococcaceae bacterium]|nr:cation transporter [Oscillospiraceae bacterium]